MAQIDRISPENETQSGLHQAEAYGTLGATSAVEDIQPVDSLSDAVLAGRVSSPGRDAWRRFRRNWAAMISLSIVLIMIVMAVFAPYMHTTGPLDYDFLNLHASPSLHHWFGTDPLGADLYTEIVYGLRVPIAVGLLGTFITVVLGTLLGVTAGYFGGILDDLLGRFTDLMFAFPSFLLAIMVLAFFGQTFDPLLGGDGRAILLTLIFSFVGWPALMRFVRSLALTLKEQQFIEAARTSGSSSWKIIWRHLIPNVWGLVLIQASLIMVGIIYTEVALSIFHLGIPPPQPDLGGMLLNGSSDLYQAQHLVIFPALTIAIMLMAFSFIGDGVRDAFDPRMNS